MRSTTCKVGNQKRYFESLCSWACHWKDADGGGGDDGHPHSTHTSNSPSHNNGLYVNDNINVKTSRAFRTPTQKHIRTRTLLYQHFPYNSWFMRRLSCSCLKPSISSTTLVFPRLLLQDLLSLRILIAQPVSSPCVVGRGCWARRAPHFYFLSPSSLVSIIMKPANPSVILPSIWFRPPFPLLWSSNNSPYFPHTNPHIQRPLHWDNSTSIFSSVLPALRGKSLWWQSILGGSYFRERV